MKAGRELDALVAEKVMGWNPLDRARALWTNPAKYGSRIWIGDPLQCSDPDMGWYPSTDIAAAWEVAEKLRIAVVPAHAGKWWAEAEGDSASYLEPGFWYERRIDEADLAETAPLAICLAALKAVHAL